MSSEPREPAPRDSAWRFDRRTALGFSLGGALLGRWLLPRAEARELVPALVSASGTDSSAQRSGTRRFLALGDIGLATNERRAVVREMASCVAREPVDGVLLLGDNFYPDGVVSSEDPAWRSGFEELLPESDFPLPFWACLGNHDHTGNVQAQVDYTARSRRWRMPARRYAFATELGDHARAEFFVLDTQEIWKSDGDPREQLAWLDEALGASDATWKVVIGHHPIRSGGAHGQEGILAKIAHRLEPLFARHDVALYLSGHDHDLQLLRGAAGWMQVVSGAGSSTRDSSRTPDTHFVSAMPGFAVVVLQESELRVEFHLAGQGLVHSEAIRSAKNVRPALGPRPG